MVITNHNLGMVNMPPIYGDLVVVYDIVLTTLDGDGSKFGTIA